MVIVAFSLVRVRIGVRVGWAEQQAFAEIHEAHEYAGDDDDDQRGREDQRRAERIVSRSQMPRPLRAPRYSAVVAVAKMYAADTRMPP